MPKRKSINTPATLGSLDAALDLLVCESFERLESVAARWEAAADVKLNPGVLRERWDEAAKRYWVMKSMDELCCTAGASSSKTPGDEGASAMDAAFDRRNGIEDAQEEVNDRMNPKVHPGVEVVHKLCYEEVDEWRRWTPKQNDIVLVELEDGAIWPGKIINKNGFLQGRTVPRGNHFFPVRIYSEAIEPTITVKSRLLPLHMRPDPPLLAAPAVISAYHHAANPTSFDQAASAREIQAAQERLHPVIGSEEAQRRLKKEKEEWNRLVNWVMNERRGEKLRFIAEEREKRLRQVGKPRDDSGDALPDDFCPKKRKTIRLPDASPSGSASDSRSTSPASSIFGPIVTPQSAVKREGTPALNGVRPRLSTPPRPASPRRTDRRRNGVFAGVGELSPRARHTWTPPRTLPSGDEMAVTPTAPPSGAFDFVSPLGPVSRGKLLNGDGARRSSLEVVKEEADEEDGWTVVTKRFREKRAGSAPAEKPQLVSDGMDQSC